MFKFATKVLTLFILDIKFHFLKSTKKKKKEKRNGTLFLCCAFDFFRRWFSVTIPSRNGKQILWRWLKILYMFAQNFILSFIWYEIRITGLKFPIWYNDSKFLRVSSIKWWYPLHKGTCFFTAYFYVSRSIRSSF